MSDTGQNGKWELILLLVWQDEVNLTGCIVTDTSGF